jgi:hypothetical protein
VANLAVPHFDAGGPVGVREDVPRERHLALRHSSADAEE